jgi:hypothetical protein
METYNTHLDHFLVSLHLFDLSIQSGPTSSYTPPPA